VKRLAWVAAAPLVVFWQAVVGQRVLAPIDGYRHYLPLHVLANRMLRAGHLPVWNPFTFSGYPLLATNQAAVLYPPNLVFLVLPAVAANNAVVILDFVIAGVGAFLLGRVLCKDDAAAVVSGLAFAFCGFMFAHITHQSMIASVSWLPWVLWGYERLRDRATIGRLAVAGGAFALVALAGHSQMVFLTVVVVAVYAVTVALAAPLERWRPLVLAAALLAVGGGLAAVQLVPTAAILHATDRSKLDYAAATTYSLPISHTPLLVFPYLFGAQPPAGPFSATYQGAWELRELTGYGGAAALVLAAAALTMARRERRVVALLAVAGVCFVMALGRSTPIGRLVYALPIAGQFRAWGRYLAGVDLAVAILAGYGVAALRTAGLARRARQTAVAAAAALVLGALIVPHIGPVAVHVAHDPAGLWAVVFPASAAVLAAALAWFATRAPRGALYALAAVVALDLVVGFGVFAEWRTASPSPAAVRRALAGRGLAVGRVPDAPGGIDRYVDLTQRTSVVRDEIDVAAVSGRHSVNGFDPLAPRDYLEAAGDMSYFGLATTPAAFTRPQSHLLDLLRVSLVLDDDPLGGPPRHWERTPALPESFVVGESTRAPRGQVLDAIQGVVPFDPRATAWVEGRCRVCRTARTAGLAGTSTVAAHRASRRTLDVRAERAAMVVVSEAWFPGWHATVDGHVAPVVRLDGIVLGVPVAAGHHSVELRYRPPGLRAGALVSGLTVVALVIGAAVRRRRPGLTG
jgi:hypothetical protein